jgi:hypothetical protein
MTTYRELHGKAVKTVTTNPSDTAAEGQIWFNSSDSTFKSAVVTEAFSSSAPVATARRGMSSSKNGTQDAMFGAGGYAAGPSTVASTEEYNGSGFSTGGNLSNARYHGTGAGTLTAGLAIGSAPDRTLVEEYDGTSWTAGGAMSTGRGAYDMGCGTQTAAMTAGGFLPPNTANTNATEHYNGSSWTASGNLTDSRRNHSGCGIQTAAVTFAGDLGPSTTNQVQNYDGSSWTNVTTTPATLLQYMAFGTQTNSVYAGGTPPTSTTSFKYDGTSISSGPAMATARGGAANAGSGTAGVLASGMTTNPTTFTGNTEEFNRSANVITAGAWASGGALGLARNGLFGVGGPSTAGLVFGGGYPDKGNTEEYDGTSWTEQNDLNTARRGLGGFGIQTAAVAVGGITSSNSSAVEHYDGSSWTNATSLPTASNEIRCGAGTQTAGLSAGGRSGPTTFLNATHEYDGSSWSSGGNLSAGRGGIAGGCNATQTAAIAFGGYTNTPQNPVSPAVAEEYDGSSWTNGGTMLKAVLFTGGIGTQTAALSAGGGTQSPSAGFVSTCQGYDGTSWSSRPSLANPNYASGSGGTSTDGFIAGGGTSPYVATTEEFTGETTSINVETLTQS